MLDNRATSILSVGESRIQVLQKKLFIKLDIITIRINYIKFGKGKTIIKNIVRVPMPIRIIIFYIVLANILFFFIFTGHTVRVNLYWTTPHPTKS
jgi:hypothetical protein